MVSPSLFDTWSFTTYAFVGHGKTDCAWGRGTRESIRLPAWCFRILERKMTTQILIGVMGTLTVIAVYYWLVRGKPKAE